MTAMRAAARSGFAQRWQAHGDRQPCLAANTPLLRSPSRPPSPHATLGAPTRFAHKCAHDVRMTPRTPHARTNNPLTQRQRSDRHAAPLLERRADGHGVAGPRQQPPGRHRPGGVGRAGSVAFGRPQPYAQPRPPGLPPQGPVGGGSSRRRVRGHSPDVLGLPVTVVCAFDAVHLPIPPCLASPGSCTAGLGGGLPMHAHTPTPALCLQVVGPHAAPPRPCWLCLRIYRAHQRGHARGETTTTYRG